MCFLYFENFILKKDKITIFENCGVVGLKVGVQEVKSLKLGQI